MTQTDFLSLIGPMQVRMFRFAYSILKTEEEAKDVVQDVLIKLWEKRDDLQKVVSVDAWCIRITRNTVLDRLKYNSYRITACLDKNTEDIHVANAGTAAELKDQLNAIRRIIDCLPEKYRSFIYLREVEGLTYQEIAQSMELSLAEVKIGIFRARQVIREKLKNSALYGTQ